RQAKQSERVDLVYHAVRPVLRQVGRKVLRLYVLAEGGLVRLVDLQALLFEKLNQLTLALEMLLGGKINRRVRRRLEFGLLCGIHLIPDALRNRQQIEPDEVRGQHDLRHDLVEFHVLDVRQRIILAVDRTRLQAGINLSVSHGGWIGANGFTEELPSFPRRHTELDTRQISGRPDFLIRFKAELANSEIGRAQNFDSKLILGHFLQLDSGLAVEELLYVSCISEQIAGCYNRPGRDLLGNVLRGDIPHLEIAALQRDELRPLLEKFAAIIALKREIVRNRVSELLHHFSADVLLREHRREAKFRLFLGECRKRRGGTKRGSSDEELAACRLQGHDFPPCLQSNWIAHHSVDARSKSAKAALITSILGSTPVKSSNARTA